MPGRIAALGALAALLLAAAPARATVGDDPVVFRLGVFAGYRTAGDPGGVSPSGLEGDVTWGGVAGFRLSRRFDVELLLDRSRTGTTSGEGIWSTVYTAGLRYRFVSDSRGWFPFLGLGFGAHTLSPAEGFSPARTWMAGLLDTGVEFPAGDRFSVRLDLRGFATRTRNDDLCFDFGCGEPGDGWMFQADATGGFVFAF